MRSTLITQAFFGSKPKQNPTNIYETEDKYLIEIEAPYFTEQDLTIEYQANKLHIKGEKKIHLPDSFQESQEIIHKLDRSIALRESLSSDSIEASLTNGLLAIAIAKQPIKQIPITIS